MRSGFDFSVPKYGMTSNKVCFQLNSQKKKKSYLELKEGIKGISLERNAFHFVASLVNSAKPKESCLKFSYRAIQEKFIPMLFSDSRKSGVFLIYITEG